MNWHDSFSFFRNSLQNFCFWNTPIILSRNENNIRPRFSLQASPRISQTIISMDLEDFYLIDELLEGLFSKLCNRLQYLQLDCAIERNLCVALVNFYNSIDLRRFCVSRKTIKYSIGPRLKVKLSKKTQKKHLKNVYFRWEISYLERVVKFKCLLFEID